MAYSQNDEEDLIRIFFRKDDQTKLAFLDCGSNDGITLSNTYACAERGWKGVLVEPSATAFGKMEELYKDNNDVVLCNFAVSDKVGTATFWESGEHLGKGDTSLLSSLKKEEMARWTTSGETFVETTVLTRTFKDVVEYAKRVTDKFDLISIDVEGLDFEILTQIDLNEVKCRMLVIEWNGQNESKFTTYCEKFGFRLLTKNGINLIYTK